jgi:replicative DNA helicase
MTADEEKILSCILLDNRIIHKANLTEEHFYDGRARRLFRAMKKCIDSQIAVDYISVLDADSEIDRNYPIMLSESIPSAANWNYYQTAIIKDYQRNKLASLGRMLADIQRAEPNEFIERAEKELLEISTNLRQNTIMHVSEVIGPTLQLIEERYNLKGKLPGISTGLATLDMLTGGFQEDRFIVIGARPSDGKSALALNMALHIALRVGIEVGFISAESSAREIVMRALSNEGPIDGQKLNSGMIAPKDFTTLKDAGMRVHDAPMWIYDAPNMLFSECRSVARQMVATYKCKILFVDYIQILQWEDRKLPRHEQVAEVSKGLKQLARELKIPVVALAQLRRDAEGREPEMADLADASQIEKDADTLIFIYHQKEEDKPSKLLVKKNRDGAKGYLDVKFKKEYIKFYELER